MRLTAVGSMFLALVPLTASKSVTDVVWVGFPRSATEHHIDIYRNVALRLTSNWIGDRYVVVCSNALLKRKFNDQKFLIRACQ